MAGPSRRLVPVGAVALAAAALTGACASGGGSDPAPSGGAAPATTGTSANPPAGPASGSDGRTEQVTIKTFAYQPSPLTVARGTTLVVENRDDIGHSITSGPEGAPDGTFDHELDGIGAKAEIRLDQAGTVTYHCSFHPGMSGTVEVR